MIGSSNPFLVSVAPMMNCTDRHDRYFLRLISPNVRLYTEMITTQALIHGDAKRFLEFNPAEHLLALQLGGCDPKVLAKCARMAEDYGYDEVNLNIGCPSDRVRSGRFGVCLMLEPNLVSECVHAMQSQVNIPITLKCRIGIDQHDSYENLFEFVKINSQAGCKIFIIHARKALSKFNPKQNREIPPLNYEFARQIKRDFPFLKIIINGGIKTVEQIDEQLMYVDGVMIGRVAYANPYLLAQIQQKYFSNNSVLTRDKVIEKFIPYVEEQLAQGVKLATMTRHLLGLFQGERGASNWRRYLSQHAHVNTAGVEIIKNALKNTISTGL